MNENNEFEEVRFDELYFSDLEDKDHNGDVSYYFRDPIVKQVVDQFVSRSDVGYNKYGQTLDSERREGVKNLGEYLQDVQEELMDAVNYIEKVKDVLYMSRTISDYQEDTNFTDKEIERIDRIIASTLKKGKFVSEKEFNKVLLE